MKLGTVGSIVRPIAVVILSMAICTTVFTECKMPSVGNTATTAPSQKNDWKWYGEVPGINIPFPP